MTKIRVLEKEGFIRKLVEENSDQFKQLEASGYKATKKVITKSKNFILMEIAVKKTDSEKNPTVDKNISKVNINKVSINKLNIKK